MCLWCGNSLIAESLTSGFPRSAPNRRRFMAYAVSAGAAMTAGGPAKAAGGAEVIFRNGTVIPMTGQSRNFEALAISDGKILAAGSLLEVSALAGSATRIVDLEGRTLLPGFIDPHHHTTLSALFSDLFIDIGYAKYPRRADVFAPLREAAAKTPPGQWIRAGGFDNLLQGGDLSMKDLDAVSTEHPIFVLYVNGHESAANGQAFQLAKITEDVGEIAGGGHFGRGPDGKLNGLIYETAVLSFLKIAIPPLTPELIARAMATYAGKAAAAGNTTLHEPGTVKPEWAPLLAKLSNNLGVRLSASLSSDSIDAGKGFASLGPGARARRFPDSRFSLYGVKFWADGSDQAESAAQTLPYLHSDKKGKTNYPVSQMTELCRAAKDAGWPILIHCQGDAAVDGALDAIEAVYGAKPATGLNVLQHATMARQDQLERVKRLGVEISFLPDLLYLYGAAYRDQIFGPERADFMEPMAAALNAGIKFSLHTDAPVSPAGPLRLLQIAVTRRCAIDHSLIGPGQAIGIDEALKAITIHAARHIGLEDTIGTLEPGKEADLTILESDPYKTDPEKLMSIKVSETWVAGEKKYG
ncbi:amidohydrolase [uncultured Rhodoblastus sp.]|uniref:amidohydrolase n=1 Tax=uncultured Rhodoblastus sp. TaxID=543037 RepID=UPI0025EAFC44|nr:amidohydrolase [uncultured Rhodoblastus sp.]